jgi:hypothetical protein
MVVGLLLLVVVVKSQAVYLYIFISVGDMLVVIKWWVKFVCLISGRGACEPKDSSRIILYFHY